jgi:DNA polymerase V
MYAIVDCNSFYCGCERVFRPDLKDKPVVVLSNNDGCVIARTDEAKALGIAMGEPYFQIKEKLKNLGIAVFSSNYQLYGDMSQRVMKTLQHINPFIEFYSIDEAFIDLAHLDIQSKEELWAYGKMLKDTVYRHTGIATSVGIAPTKTLSKMANKLSKKKKAESQGVGVLFSNEDIKEAMSKIPVRDVWGIGHAYAAKLEKMHIEHPIKLMAYNREWFGKNLGGVVGLRLYDELSGKRTHEINDPRVAKEHIFSSRMFSRLVTNITEMQEAVASYATIAVEKLRRQNSAAGSVSVHIGTRKQGGRGSYFNSSKHIVFTQATDSASEIIKAAKQLVVEIFEEGAPYNRAGVSLSGIVPAGSIQGSFWSTPNTEKNAKLSEVIDKINVRMGNNTVFFAACGEQKAGWKMRQDLLSPQYSSDWDKLRWVKG